MNRLLWSLNVILISLNSQQLGQDSVKYFLWGYIVYLPSPLPIICLSVYSSLYYLSSMQDDTFRLWQTRWIQLSIMWLTDGSKSQNTLCFSRSLERVFEYGNTGEYGWLHICSYWTMSVHRFFLECTSDVDICGSGEGRGQLKQVGMNRHKHWMDESFVFKTSTFVSTLLSLLYFGNFAQRSSVFSLPATKISTEKYLI